MKTVLLTDLTSWRKLEKTSESDVISLKNYPVQLKTSASLGSNAKMIIYSGRDSSLLDVFGFYLAFNSIATFRIQMCDLNDDRELNLTECLAAGEGTDIEWTFERSSRTVLLFCNGVKVVDYEALAASTTDNDNGRCQKWTPNLLSSLKIAKEDTATTDYRFMRRSECFSNNWGF